METLNVQTHKINDKIEIIWEFFDDQTRRFTINKTNNNYTDISNINETFNSFDDWIEYIKNKFNY